MAGSRDDHYQVLGLNPGAAQEEIKRAYRRLARRHHPDLNPGDQEAGERFRRLSAAYEVLCDPDQQELVRCFENGSRGPASPEAAAPPVPGASHLAPEHQGIEDLFRGPSPGASQRGGNVQATVELTFEQACDGASLSVWLERMVRCPSCHGSGTAKRGAERRCGQCHGSGYERSGFFQVETRPCARCGGSGLVRARDCVDCAGAGLVAATETVSVDIPPGVHSGHVVEVPGAGDASERGEPGDLELRVQVAPHPRFERQGDDIRVRVPISVAEAILGATIDVPTLGGPRVVEIPPGAQSGGSLRLAGLGMPSLHTGIRGDQIVELVVEIPRALDARSRQLIEEFARLNPRSPRVAPRGRP